VTGTLRPPPYKPRLKEGEVDREEKLDEGQLANRDRVIRSLVVILALWVYSGFVFLVREVLPGGGYPWPFSYVPTFIALPFVLLCAVVWANDRGKRKGLLLALTVLLAASLLGSVFQALKF
jgi:hypothetical protein